MWMPDIFTKAKRSAVMSRIRSGGNKATKLELELELTKIFQENGITGWRRNQKLRFMVLRALFGMIFVSRATDRGLCGWRILAWASDAGENSCNAPGVVAGQDRRQQEARPSSEPPAPPGRMDRRPHLAA